MENKTQPQGAGGEAPIVVLWVSRHEPLGAQVEALKQKLGNVNIVQISGTIPNAEYVVELAKGAKAKYVIPVLPLSFIARLVELSKQNGFVVLWAEMEQVKQMLREPEPHKDFDPYCETVTTAVGIDGSRTYKVMRFKQFHVIKAVKLELQPL